MHHVVAGWLGESHRRIIQDFWNANIGAPKHRRLSVRAAARALGLASSTLAHEPARGCEGRPFYDHIRHERAYYPYSVDKAQEAANWATAQKGPRSRFTSRLAGRLAFRLVRGHWELDTVVPGVGGSGGLLVLVERKTRQYRAARITCVSQSCVLRAVRKLVRSGTPGPVLSVTADNGCEFLDQDVLDRAFGAEVYHTRACAAYEKGSVEDANRLLRRWFPEGMDFDRVTPAEMAEVEDAVNSIHRRSLGGRMANQAFAEVA